MPKKQIKGGNFFDDIVDGIGSVVNPVTKLANTILPAVTTGMHVASLMGMSEHLQRSREHMDEAIKHYNNVVHHLKQHRNAKQTYPKVERKKKPLTARQQQNLMKKATIAEFDGKMKNDKKVSKALNSEIKGGAVSLSDFFHEIENS